MIALRSTRRKNLKINQKEWDEYSKGMSFYERKECFVDFLEDNKARHGWKYYYVPRIMNKR